jgi:hypothetical protein
MPSLQQRLAALRGLSGTTRATILRGALTHADPDELPLLVEAAAHTDDPRALAAVLRHAGRLGANGLSYLRVPHPLLLDAMRILLSDADGATIVNTIRTVGALGDPALLGPVVARLGAIEPEIAKAAEDAVLAVTMSLVGPDGRWNPGRPALEALDQALAEAGSRFRHHRSRQVLMAIALVSHKLGPRLGAILENEESSLAMVLRTVPDRIEEPLVARNLLSWVGDGPLDRPAKRRLGLLEDAAAYSMMLERRHLLLVPARRRSLRQVDRPIRCVPDAPTTLRLTTNAQAALPLFMGRLGVPKAALLPRLASMARLDEPRARLHALVELTSRPSEAARAAAETFVEDASPAIAHIATVHVDAPDRTELHQRLVKSPHRVVADAGRRGLARSSANALRDHWRTLSPPDRVAAARLLLERRRSSLVAALRDLLTDGDAAVKHQVIALARRLRIVEPLLPAMIVQMKGDDVKLASAAMSALTSPAAEGPYGRLRRAAVRYGLHHADPRVRANAVEVLSDDERREQVRRLADLAYNDENRPRGNAVMSMCREDTGEAGVEALRIMLRDSRPLHRVSAIWVASRRRVRPVGTQLRSIVRDDPAPAIRARAWRALKLIEHPRQAIPA